LSDDREERNILPPVPLVAGDIAALQSWAQVAKAPTLAMQLSKVENAGWLARRVSPTAGENRLTFGQPASGASPAIKTGDTLVIYIKGHGLALDVSASEKPDVRPILVKSLSETDLSSPWYRDEQHVIDIRELLQEL